MMHQGAASRIEYMDALKALGIFLVLWGHVLQNLYGNYDFFHNQAFEVIYAFHMPLFFMISGFFFVSSLKLKPLDFFTKKATQLIVPCFTWATILFGAKAANSLLNGATIETIFHQLPMLYDPNNWPFWFLKQLFISFVVVYSTLKFTSNKLIGFGLSLLAVLLIPSAEYQRFLLPLFWLGIYLKSQIDFILQYSTQLLIATGLLFVGCLIFWDGYYSIYVTPFPALISLETFNWDVVHLPIAVYRWLVGAAGSVFLLLLFSKVYRNNAFFTALNTIGAMTLGIYTTQFGLLELGLSKVVNLSQVNLWLFDFVLAPAIALAVLAVCVVLVKILSKNKYLSFLFIGNQLSQSKN